MSPATGRPPTRAASRQNGAANGTARRRKAERAVAEAKPDKARAKKVKFRGLTLKLPAALPPEVMFDVIEMEADQENAMPVMRLLRSLLGGDQFVAVRNKIAGSGGFDDVTGLIGDVLGEYGVGLGESSASQRS